MPSSAVLLRLLLVLALVLDGAAPAFARHAHAGTAVATVPSDAHCHETAAPMPAPAADPGADCCDGGLCDCACTASAAMLALTVPFVASVAPSGRIGHRLAAGHHAPALAHPIRPPIDPAATGA